ARQRRIQAGVTVSEHDGHVIASRPTPAQGATHGMDSHLQVVGARRRLNTRPERLNQRIARGRVAGPDEQILKHAPPASAGAGRWQLAGAPELEASEAGYLPVAGPGARRVRAQQRESRLSRLNVFISRH